MKISRLLAILLLPLAALAAAAQEPASPNGGRPSIEELKRNIERWKALPAKDRERIKQAYRNYRQFRPEQRTSVQENFQKFRNLPAERRRELSKKLEGRSPQQREHIAHKLRALQQMGSDRRKMAVAFARMAQSLTPEQKRQLEQLQTPEEKKRFLGTAFRGHVVRMYLGDKSADERAQFQGLPPEEQKKQLQKFFRERVVRGPPGERGGGK